MSLSGVARGLHISYPFVGGGGGAKVGAPHPNLVRPDLMGDMVKALTAADIECPIYISVQWDERNARLHPEWRARSAVEQRPILAAPPRLVCAAARPRRHGAARQGLLAMRRFTSSSEAL